MIIVTAPSKDGVEEFEYDTDDCEIIDGALIIHRKVSGGNILAPICGFAPGAWITFEVILDAD